jgi:hypothetical protein
MPFDAITFASCANLAASANDRPPIDARRDGRSRRGWFGLSLACGPLAAGV